MSLKNQVKRLEMEAESRSGREVCQHMPALIEWPDGSIEHEGEHQCGKPRLRIIIGYTDGNDERTQQNAVEAFEDSRRENPDVAPAETLSILKEYFPLTPETEAKLQALANASEA